MGERGSALPLVAMLLVVAGVLAAGVAEVGGAAIDRASAQAAADAAALAGAVGGEAAATRLAAANDGRLVSYDEAPPGDVQVMVEVGSATARARAVSGSAAAGNLPWSCPAHGALPGRPDCWGATRRPEEWRGP